MTTKRASSPGETALSQPPVGEWLVTSGPSRQACQVGAHRSETEQRNPSGLLLSFPATRRHSGVREDGSSNPCCVQPPAHPAMLGQFLISRKPSRVPSEHPTIKGSLIVGARSTGSSPPYPFASLAGPPDPSIVEVSCPPPKSEASMSAKSPAAPSLARPIE